MNFDHLQLGPLAQVLAGAALLFFGRSLFWLFVGIVGFLVGMHFGAQFAEGHGELTILLIAIGVGLLAALLAVILQRVAVALAGALAGGTVAMQLASGMGSANEAIRWFFFVVGAVLSAVLVTFIFDWALIGISALTGAHLVAQVLPLDHVTRLIVTGILFVIGILVQIGMFKSLAKRPML